MELLVFILGGAGLMAIIIGRHIMIRDTGGDLPMLWIIALRLIPFSELVYMVRHYTLAKTGGIISIVGMWMMVPFFGHRLWEAQKEAKQTMEQAASAFSAEMERKLGDESTTVGDRRLEEKEAKVAQINARLAWWHQQLQQKRSALGGDPASVGAFNADAAAYSAFNMVARDEATELSGLRAKLAAKPKAKTAARK